MLYKISIKEHLTSFLYVRIMHFGIVPTSRHSNLKIFLILEHRTEGEHSLVNRLHLSAVRFPGPFRTRSRRILANVPFVLNVTAHIHLYTIYIFTVFFYVNAARAKEERVPSLLCRFREPFFECDYVTCEEAAHVMTT